MDENTISLVNQLCENYLEGLENAHINPDFLKKLQIGFVNNLFARKNRSETSNEEDLSDPQLRIKSEIISQIRTNTDTETGKRVDRLLSKVTEIADSCSDKNTLNETYLFLCKLSELKDSAVKLRPRKVKSAVRLVDTKNRLSSTIIHYDDINWDVFYEDPSPLDTTSEYPFYDEPGSGIGFLKNYCNEVKLPSSFGDLNELYDGKCKLWRFDLNRAVEAAVQDEGFITPGSGFSEGSSLNEVGCGLQNSETLADDNFDHLDVTRIDNRSWDRLGNEVPHRELPFTSESVDTVIHLWNVWNANRNYKKKAAPIGEEITFEELLTDVKYLLFGTPSYSFYYNSETRTFHMRRNLHTSTLSPELLSAFCESLIKCANYYTCLKTFAEKRISLPFGPIHKVFCKGVKDVLNMYQHCLLKLDWNSVRFVCEVEPLILPLQRKLSFLSRLCFITTGDNFSGNKFPSGIQLLDYLYGYLSKVFKTDINYILFYLFELCCDTYLKIVSEWIFDGCFSNVNNYKEFFIEIHRENELCRDWRRVNCITAKERKVPKFLERFYKEIFICGKSVNLLKICSSEEILKKIIGNEHPPLRCCFNQKEILEYVEEWQDFRVRSNRNFDTNVTIKDELGVKCDKSAWYKEIKRIRQDSERKAETIDRENESTLKNAEQEAATKLLEVSVEEKNELEISAANSESAISAETTEPKPVEDAEIKIVISAEDEQEDGTILSENKENINDSANRNGGSGDHRQIAKASILATKPPVNLGDGDAPSSRSEYARNRVKAMCSEYENRLHSPAGTTIPAAPPSKFSTPLSACQENRRKVMSSEYHNMLKAEEAPSSAPPTLNAVTRVRDEIKKKIMASEYHSRLNADALPSKPEIKLEPKNVVLSAREANKRKVMLSEYHSRLRDDTEERTSPKKRSGPMTALEEQRIKAMSSEYHSRLNSATPGQLEKEVETRSPKTLTECEKNRLKIMSSEYHVRLQDADRGTVAEEKREAEFTECEKNKMKVAASEYQLTKGENDAETEKKQDSVTKDEEENGPPIRVEEKAGEEGTSTRTEEDAITNDIPLQSECRYYVQDYVFFEKEAFIRTELRKNADPAFSQNMDVTSVFYYLSQSISVPLNIQMKLINEAILNVFIKEECYLTHLLTLRNYLLLRKPEFSLSLTNSIFKSMEKTEKPYTLLNNYVLLTVLQRAILASSSRKSIRYEKKLSLVVEDSVPDSFTLVDIKELNCVSLTYSIKWPVNILITEPILKKYSKIFTFLMQIQRVLWTLKRDFISLKNLKVGKSMQFVKIQLYRHNMTQIIKIFQDYIMREALETCWNNFVEHLTTVEVDLDVLYLSHLKYINRTLQRCFLCDESAPCHEAILNLFTVVLKYHEALKEGVWKRNVQVNFLYHTNFKKINSIYEDFISKLNDVRSCLRTLVYTKQKMYFELLYLELSENTIN